MSFKWGWWLQDIPKEEETTTTGGGDYRFVDAFTKLKDAEDFVKEAIRAVESMNSQLAHEYISLAHQKLREASRILGYRPREEAEKERLRTMLKYYEEL